MDPMVSSPVTSVGLLGPHRFLLVLLRSGKLKSSPGSHAIGRTGHCPASSSTFVVAMNSSLTDWTLEVWGFSLLVFLYC